MARPEHLTFFAKFIEEQLGIVYSEFNDFQLERRLQEIALKRGFPNVHELHRQAVVQFDYQTKKMVLDVATNNETYFFRDPQVFASLYKEIFPLIFDKAAKENRRPRIWSIACSYGQEAYSLAILSRELTRTNGAFRDADILATDIASHAVEKTSAGIYSQADVGRGLESKYLDTYFDRVGPDWKVKAEIRSLVRTETVNLLTDQFGRFGQFDLILCRNVLIYQSVSNKSNAIRKIKGSLHSPGYLVLGAGETLIGLPEQMPVVQFGSTVVFTTSANLNGASRAG